MIYNGPSIYNQGGVGGGGAYSDGGALVDGDLIQVTNNTISTYENTSRNEINYYFEVADNEIINAVIELTNDVNATVNIYVVKGGMYVPLGNVGGNTVTAGEEYKINVSGDSFTIEQVTPGANPLLYVFGILMPVVKIGNKYWTAENMYSHPEGVTIGGAGQNDTPCTWWLNNNENSYGHNGTKYNLYYNAPASKMVDNIGNGWRIPFKTDFQDLSNAVGGVIQKLISWGIGTNDTGFSGVPSGNGSSTGPDYVNDGSTLCLRYKHSGNNYGGFISCNQYGPFDYNDFNENYTRYVPVRLCKDA